MATNVLMERDTNAQVQRNPAKQDEKPMSMEYHRQVLESRVQDGKMQNTYISPSDTIMSPATAKLAAFKTKHLGKGMKPQTLFAKTLANNAANSGGTPPPTSRSTFGDIPKKEDTSQ